MNISEKIRDAIKQHKAELPRYEKLYRYYLGKHDKILNRVLPDPEKPNNKIVTGYCSQVVNTIVGYFASKPISYISKTNNQKYLDDLHRILALNNEEDVNAELVKLFTIYGKAYELMYTDKNADLRFTYYSPVEMFVKKDSKGNIEFALRYWVEGKDDDKVTKVEYIDDKGVYYFFSNDNETFIADPNEDDIEHFFNEVPVNAYQNSSDEQGDFEQFIPIIDAIDLLLSDSLNETEAFVNAYLVLAGHRGTTKEDVEEMKQNGVLLVDSAEQAKFLIKDAATSFQKELFETLDTMLHEQSSTPKLTSEKFSSNLSGVAIGFKLFGLESKVSTKERKMDKALKKRIRLITTILNKRGNNYDWLDIRTQFSRNLPQNEAEITDQMTKLVNMIPMRELLSWHPRVQEPDQLLIQLKKENDSINLDKIGV